MNTSIKHVLILIGFVILVSSFEVEKNETKEKTYETPEEVAKAIDQVIITLNRMKYRLKENKNE